MLSNVEKVFVFVFRIIIELLLTLYEFSVKKMKRFLQYVEARDFHKSTDASVLQSELEMDRRNMNRSRSLRWK